MKKKIGKYKEPILITSSFLIGSLFTLLIINYTPLGNNHVITKNNTKIYEKNSLANSVEKIYDAVVDIEGYKNNELNSTGTGFVYKIEGKYGYIFTNEHVVSDSDNIKGTFTSNEEAELEVLGKDEYIDLAILRVNKKYINQVATIGSSEDALIGDTVFTVGSPLGSDYRGSVTAGVLSGKNRDVKTTVSEINNKDWVMKVLQIDASINPGNSGGPLLNVNGEVIGICSLKLVDNDIEGMAFAIPIEDAMKYTDDLENGKKIKWPSLGIRMVDITNKYTIENNKIDVPKNINEGVVILDISKNSSADDAGLKKGDIIIKIDNTKIKDTSYLKSELSRHKVNDTIEVTFIRNNKEKNIKIKLKEKEN